MLLGPGHCCVPGSRLSQPSGGDHLCHPPSSLDGGYTMALGAAACFLHTALPPAPTVWSQVASLPRLPPSHLVLNLAAWRWSSQQPCRQHVVGSQGGHGSLVTACQRLRCRWREGTGSVQCTGMVEKLYVGLQLAGTRPSSILTIFPLPVLPLSLPTPQHGSKRRLPGGGNI